MKVRLRYEHFIPRTLGVRGIVLYPWVLFSEPREKVPTRVVRHEFVHVRQVREIGVARFYVAYLVEYVKHLVRFRNHDRAYFAIRFEAEAYQLESTIQLTHSELAEIDSRNRST